MRLHTIIMLCALIIKMGCAGTQPPPVAKEPTTPATDESDALKKRFEAAYFALACMANKGVDPLMTFKPLKRPLDYLQSLVERKDQDFAAAMRVLEQNGFASIEAFRAVEMHLRADRAYWNTIDARFVDELLKCK